MSRYLDFEDAPSPTGKTVITDVRSKRSRRLLGQIRWYAPWRQYAFYPDAAIFNKECMNDIIGHIDGLMEARNG